MRVPNLMHLHGWRVNDIRDAITQDRATALQFFRACWETFKREFQKESLEDYWDAGKLGKREILHHLTLFIISSLRRIYIKLKLNLNKRRNLK